MACGLLSVHFLDSRPGTFPGQPYRKSPCRHPGAPAARLLRPHPTRRHDASHRPPREESHDARRRTVLTAGAAALTTGCGSSGNGERDGSTAPETASSETSAGELTRTSDVPAGGGTILRDRKVVVTRPSAGQFRAFSAVCTHAGCIVAAVTDGTIDRACHGSRFSIEDGAVENGPATRPLPAERITVEGDSIRLGQSAYPRAHDHP